MCNIAGYTGKDRAAGILLEMMQKQEGFSEAGYSGIATIHEGRIHHAKIVGNFADLRANTDAENLPGSVGIAHARPCLGGDVEWAHPFVNDAGTIALVVNGHRGFFEKLGDENRIIADLIAQGRQFRSASPDPNPGVGAPTKLPDGRIVHGSEVMCHLISSLAERDVSPGDAMRKAFMSMPEEIVGLCLFAQMPEAIVASRFNQPLMIGFAHNAVYMATSALCFPESAGIEIINPMPISSTAVISVLGMDVRPFAPNPGKVASIFPFARASEIIRRELAGGDGKTLQDLKDATAGLWPADAAPQKDMLVYEILRSMHAEGMIQCRDYYVDGIAGAHKTVKKIRQGT